MEVATNTGEGALLLWRQGESKKKSWEQESNFMTWVETRRGEKEMKSSQKENGKTSFLTLEDDE